MAEWLVIETQNLLIAVGHRSNPRPIRISANSRLSFFFLLLFLELLSVVFLLMFAKLRFCVYLCFCS